MSRPALIQSVCVNAVPLLLLHTYLLLVLDFQKEAHPANIWILFFLQVPHSHLLSGRMSMHLSLGWGDLWEWKWTKSISTLFTEECMASLLLKLGQYWHLTYDISLNSSSLAILLHHWVLAALRANDITTSIVVINVFDKWDNSHSMIMFFF